MPTYLYRCDQGHVTELVQSIHDGLPSRVECRESGPDVDVLGHDSDAKPICNRLAERLFTAPAAIHFHGGGFYATDYKGRYDRKRRPNPGDDLPIPTEAAITRAEGAEYDPPKRMPDVIQRQAA